jgi:hypothetical protein
LYGEHVLASDISTCKKYEVIPVEDISEKAKPKFVSGNNPTTVHPTHYSRLNPEPGDVAREWELTFWLGDAVKYISRAGYKVGSDIIQDLEKARHCIDKEIEYQKQLKSSV